MRALVTAEVRLDVLEGIGAFLSGATFALDGPLAAVGALVDGPFSVVAWRLSGVADRAGFTATSPRGTTRAADARGSPASVGGTDPGERSQRVGRRRRRAVARTTTPPKEVAPRRATR